MTVTGHTFCFQPMALSNKIISFSLIVISNHSDNVILTGKNQSMVFLFIFFDAFFQDWREFAFNETSNADE